MSIKVLSIAFVLLLIEQCSAWPFSNEQPRAILADPVFHLIYDSSVVHYDLPDDQIKYDVYIVTSVPPVGAWVFGRVASQNGDRTYTAVLEYRDFCPHAALNIADHGYCFDHQISPDTDRSIVCDTALYLQTRDWTGAKRISSSERTQDLFDDIPADLREEMSRDIAKRTILAFGGVAHLREALRSRVRAQKSPPGQFGIIGSPFVINYTPLILRKEVIAAFRAEGIVGN